MCLSLSFLNPQWPNRVNRWPVCNSSCHWTGPLRGEQTLPVSYLVALSISNSLPRGEFTSLIYSKDQTVLLRRHLCSCTSLSHHRTPSEGFFLKRYFLSCFTLKPLQRRVLTQAAPMEMEDKFCFTEWSSELCEASRKRQWVQRMVSLVRTSLAQLILEKQQPDQRHHFETLLCFWGGIPGQKLLTCFLFLPQISFTSLFNSTGALVYLKDCFCSVLEKSFVN